MPELLPELEEKRDKANGQAESHRRRRDELNDKTKEWIRKRDALNAQVREIIGKAAEHKAERDRLNEEVKAAKTERDTWNRTVAGLLEDMNRLKRQKIPRGGVPVEKLKRDLRGLEFRQQTSVLAVDKERDLVEQIGSLQTRIQRREEALKQDEEIRDQQGKIDAAKEKAEAFHKEVGEKAEEAQTHHDAMVGLYEQADEVRGAADQAQEQFIKTKIMADEEHQKHIDFIRQVHDLDKVIHGIRAKAARARFQGEVSEKREAQDIYNRFKKGEKLSTEDLLILQKSGYL